MLNLAQSSIRLGPMGGVLGFDMGVVVSIAESLRYDAGAVADLIGSAQSIIVDKLNHK